VITISKVLACCALVSSALYAADYAKLPAYRYAGGNAVEAAVATYAVQEFANHYEPADISIPVVNVVAVDSGAAGETLVWGSFWVFNYELRGDTLSCVSGGEYPGLAHLQKSKDGSYRVKALEVVEDGSRYTGSAKRIFGKHYGAFTKMQSDTELRERKRVEMIGDYVRVNKLPISGYQDYGWEVMPI